MDSTQTVTHVSLCAGYGGIDLGLKRAVPNLRTVAFSEIEAFACANLVAKMEAGHLDAAPIWTDLKTFPWGQFHGKVHILSGGYPCQPFSAAGKRLGTDDPRHLWPFIADGIRVMRPQFCFFENVEGHISLGLREVIGDLESLGYAATWGLFSAAEVGAPHQRKRIFILAHRKGTRLEGYHQLLSGCSQSRWDAQRQAGQACGSHSSGDVWPSRPGQLQHGWEPPRVVGGLANAASQRSGSAGGDIIHQERTASQTGRASLSQDTERQDGAAITDHQSASGDGAVVGQVQLGNALLSGSSSQRNGDWQQNGLGQSGEVVGNAAEPRLEISGGSAAEMGQPRTQPESQRPDDCVGDADCGGQPFGIHAGCGGEEAGGGQGDSQSPECWQAEPTLGGDIDGPAGWVDYAELCVSCDNRTDELRLLGNGVVPACAERAFRTLIQRLL